jgi:N6-adenosine-specific RNA methylase IME4
MGERLMSNRESFEVHIDEVVVGVRHRKDLGDLEMLADSLAEIGQLQPIGLDPDGELVFGERRLRAAERLGWTSIQAVEVDVDALIAERDENAVRKDFTPSERVSIAEAIRSRIGSRQGQRTDSLLENIPEVPVGTTTREHAAKSAGFGNETTYRQAKTVVENGSDALVDAMDSGAVAVSAAAKIAGLDHADQVDIVQRVVTGEARSVDDALKKRKREERLATVGEAVGIPEGKFRVLCADPPWAYSNSGLDQSAAGHYDTLPAAEIAERWRDDVRAVTTDESVLFLWATSPLLPEGLLVMREWGFEFVTSFVWTKPKAPGLGWWANTKHELLLVGRRKKTPPPLEKVDSVIAAPVRGHSQKPEVFYEAIERMYPVSGERPVHLELFARRDREGWRRGLYNQEKP